MVDELVDELRTELRVVRVGHDVRAFLDVLNDEVAALQRAERFQNLGADLTVTLDDCLNDRLSEERSRSRPHPPPFSQLAVSIRLLLALLDRFLFELVATRLVHVLHETTD